MVFGRLGSSPLHALVLDLLNGRAARARGDPRARESVQRGSPSWPNAYAVALGSPRKHGALRLTTHGPCYGSSSLRAYSAMPHH
jgi:hypothetical protein